MDYKLNEFKALIFEFMGNGSLQKWLHPNTDGTKQSRNLNLLQRLNVAVDVASALQYLHEQCKNPVIHCGLKPNNVLLDDDMVAHVSDFGLARLISTANDSSQSMSSVSTTTRMKGTIGYAPPEYGMGCPASKEGDAYSFGILVLEMFSGRSPIDEIFKDGLNLHSFVKAALPESLVQIMDPNLLTEEIEETNAARAATEEEKEVSNINGNLSKMSAKARSCVVSVLEIGIGCSAESPKERMSMEDVSRQLNLVRKTYLGISIHKGRTGEQFFPCYLNP
ncbi:probable LRR receptor-like serine/threonine-protein kinase At3g47570 [Hevea brasiliensis]|uniref:probable LRR receptor-like serine/threonine-protein kinase At3g47570 n=1 Tax=Hevea brasiliensis TaxID=3981 RepID=UPI0025F64E79|nr:probable LRR receptor-like serine/threonine-protein kinase At3g47570 [Hevea brasiliensis]